MDIPEWWSDWLTSDKPMSAIMSHPFGVIYIYNGPAALKLMDEREAKNEMDRKR